MKLYMIVSLLLAVWSVSCRKDHGTSPAKDPEPAPSKALQLTIMLNRQLGEILERVYANAAAYREVNAAIYSGYYEDERVYLKDLLDPGSSALYRSARMRGLEADTGVFRKQFYEIAGQEEYVLLSAHLKLPLPRKRPPAAAVAAHNAVLGPDPAVENTLLLQGYAGEAAIYFPYSANFAAIGSGEPSPAKLQAIPKATLVATDRDADGAMGRQPNPCPDGQSGLCYRDVYVDDGYVAAQPTHIITSGAVTSRPPPLLESVTSTTVTRVFHGWSRLTRQMDKLISLTGNGGGSEIKIGRINNYLGVSDQQVTRFHGDLITVYFTRAEIRNNTWKRIYSIWDPNWSYQDVEQIYAVYEDDTQGKKTFSGNLSGSVNLPGKPSVGKGQGEVGFKVEVTTQDEIILQRKLDRKSYLKEGITDQGWGYFSDPDDFLEAGSDWPVYDGGAVWQYTLPYRIN